MSEPARLVDATVCTSIKTYMRANSFFPSLLPLAAAPDLGSSTFGINRKGLLYPGGDATVRDSLGTEG